MGGVEAAERRSGILQLALGMAVVGTVGVFMEESGQGPINAVFFRCVFGALVLLAFCAARGWLRDLRLAPRQWALILFGGVCIVLNWVAFFAAIRHSSIAFATIVYHVQPFWVVLAGSVLFGERLSGRKLGWIAIAFAGLALATGIEGAEPGRLLGAGLAVLASLLYTGTVLSTKALRGVRPHLTAMIHAATGIVLLAPFVGIADLPASPGPWGWLAGLGVVHTGLVYVLMYAAYPKLPTPVIAVLAFVYPASAILADWLVYGHRLGLGQAAGMALIALSSLAVTLGWRLWPARRVATAG
ncbi:DMT family transporter [Inquilinus sp. NPDC058860]|uniref:DMT family transporter n=1 Tax=Inquilinus sp. NPDC058860 TaxID=3346652 RepID=UPI0036C08F3E